MKTILIIFLVYWSGFGISWVIADWAIKHYKTKESPLKGALFSWLLPIALFINAILYGVSRRYAKFIDGDEKINEL